MGVGDKKEGRASTRSAQTGWERTEGLFLHPHQSLTPSQPFSLEILFYRSASRFRFCFRLAGPIDHLRIPPPIAPARRDGLWQHTCFEAFIALADGGYAEFNFSPSTEWAAYRFAGYREGMSNSRTEAPSIRVKKSDHSFDLAAEIAAPLNPVRLGLCAVIEEADGTKSYWALRHPPGDRPDFHHPDCFAIELPSPA